MTYVTLKTDFKPIIEKHFVEKYLCMADMVRNQWVFRFLNNKGVSVVSHRRIPTNEFITYGNKEKPFEVCLIEFLDDTKNFKLIDEPIGYLTEKEVNDILYKVERGSKHYGNHKSVDILFN